jgi:hypothetical protein
VTLFAEEGLSADLAKLGDAALRADHLRRQRGAVRPGPAEAVATEVEGLKLKSSSPATPSAAVAGTSAPTSAATRSTRKSAAVASTT